MTDQQPGVLPRVVPPPRSLTEARAAVTAPPADLHTDTSETPKRMARDIRYYATQPIKWQPPEPPPEPADGVPIQVSIAAWKARARWFERAHANARHEQDREFVLTALRESFPALLCGLLEAQGIPADNADRLAAQIHPDRFITVDLELDVDLITSTVRLLANPSRRT